MMAKGTLAAFAAAGLVACASIPPSADSSSALLRPCANPADWSPWLLVDAWEDGDVYRPATQFREDRVMVYAYEGTTYDNGKWSLAGRKLHFDTNNRGAMKNTQGGTGEWTLERACDS